MKEFLDFDLEIEPKSDSDSYKIILENGNSLFLKDVLFSCPEGEYKKNIPLASEVENAILDFERVKFEFPVIFGSSDFIVNQNTIEIKSDIFGACFFMLSRYEEMDDFHQDEHERFPFLHSLAGQCGFYQEPIVDIYVYFIHSCLRFLDPSIPVFEKKIFVQPSHDLDYLTKYTSIRSVFGAMKRGLVKGRSAKHALQYLRHSMQGTNPYDVINMFMELAENRDTKATFYFLNGSNKRFDSMQLTTFPDLAKRYFGQIKEKGHRVGMHPGYDSFNDFDVLKKEKENLENFFKEEITLSRQHYLRFKTPLTWRLLDEIGIEEDSTMMYAEKPGFRCGTSRTYTVFDVETRKTLKLKERPLILMDTGLLKSKGLLEEKIEEVEKLKEVIRQYGGEWTFLIHNSNYYWLDEMDYHKIWDRLYKI